MFHPFNKGCSLAEWSFRVLRFLNQGRCLSFKETGKSHWQCDHVDRQSFEEKEKLWFNNRRHHEKCSLFIWKFTASLCSLGPWKLLIISFYWTSKKGLKIREGKRNWASFKEQREFPSWKAPISKLFSRFATHLYPSVSAESCNKEKNGKNYSFLCLCPEHRRSWSSAGIRHLQRLENAWGCKWASLHPTAGAWCIFPLWDRDFIDCSLTYRVIPCSSVTHHYWFPILITLFFKCNFLPMAFFFKLKWLAFHISGHFLKYYLTLIFFFQHLVFSPHTFSPQSAAFLPYIKCMI